MVFDFTISERHPALAGHFPGRPIVPAALLLDNLSAILAEQIDQVLCSVKQVKFIIPVLPKQTIKVEYSQKTLTDYRFKCSVAGKVVVRGIVSTSSVSSSAPIISEGQVDCSTDIADLYGKLPHHGDICLLDVIENHDQDSIHAVAIRSLKNPLIRHRRLPGWAALEYAAQAFACHGVLNASMMRGSPGEQTVGEIPRTWVIAIKYLVCQQPLLPEPEAKLDICARIIAQQQGVASYEFGLWSENQILSFGQVNVAFDIKDPTS